VGVFLTIWRCILSAELTKRKKKKRRKRISVSRDRCIQLQFPVDFGDRVQLFGHRKRLSFWFTVRNFLKDTPKFWLHNISIWDVVETLKRRPTYRKWWFSMRVFECQQNTTIQYQGHDDNVKPFTICDTSRQSTDSEMWK